MCRRFDTIPAYDGQTDGRTDRIAVASTALAKRRAVKTLNGKVVANQLPFEWYHCRCLDI